MAREHFGANTRFVAARRSRRWTQEDFAEEYAATASRLGFRGVVISVRQIRRWESAQPPWPARTARRVLTAMFQQPLDALGFTPPDCSPEEPVERRQFLGVAAVGLVGLTDGTRTKLHRALTPAQDPADVDHFEAAAERFSRGYGGRAPETVLTEVTAELAALAPLLDSTQPTRTRMRLSHSAGRMGAVAAVILHDQGRHDESMRWFNTARVAAGEAGDRELAAWVLARAAMVPMNYGAPSKAVDLAGRARALTAGQATPALALALAVQARSYALLGDRGRAYEAIDAADRTADALTGGQSADTWFGYPMHRHAVHMSQALTRLQDVARAGGAQDRAAALAKPTSHMTGALIALDRATCLGHAGDPAEGCRLATRSLSALPTEFRGGLVESRARELLAALPGGRRSEPATRELADVLRGTS